MASKIGLYIYQLYLFRPDGYGQVPFASSGKGSELYKFLPKFINGKKSSLQNNDIERSWRLEPQPDSGRAYHGIVRYGTYGFGSKIIDPQDNQTLFDRSPDHVEEIPLYYQFWIPESGSFGFAALQSFRDRSCVTQVLSALTQEFNKEYDHIRVTPRKIMPIDDDLYRNAPVKKLIFSRKKVPKDRADVLKSFSPEELNVELSFSARRRGRFGTFADIAPEIRKSRGTSALVFEGIEFDEVSALVSFGGSYLKVGIFGPSNNAGVVDVTDEVTIGDGDHPTFDSISDVSSRVIADFRNHYGMK